MNNLNDTVSTGFEVIEDETGGYRMRLAGSTDAGTLYKTRNQLFDRIIGDISGYFWIDGIKFSNDVMTPSFYQEYCERVEDFVDNKIRIGNLNKKISKIDSLSD